MNQKILGIFTSSIIIACCGYNLSIPESLAQENHKILLAQSSSEIKVRDIKGFKGVIVNVAVSPDGETLIVGSNDSQVTGIDLNTLETKYSQPSRVNPFSDIAFSSDGDFFAVCSKNTVIIYETSTGNIVRTLSESSSSLRDVAISPDNKIVVAVSDQDYTIKVWDLEEGSLIKEIGENVGAVTSVTFDPDNNFFVTGSILTDRVIQFWDPETLELLHTSEKQPGYINSVQISDDGNKLIAAVRNYVKVWDLMTKQETLNLKGPQLEINKIAISPDNRLVATANREGTIMIIDLNREEIVSILKGHEGWVQSVTFSPDGQNLYSGAEDKIVKVWDVSNF